MSCRLLTLVCAAALAAAHSSARAQTPLPPLPAIAFGNFSPAVRPQIEEAFRAAEKNPNNAETAGTLGMVLHAYREYEPAAACYERAHGLAPGDVRWSYYLGVTHSWLGNHKSAAQALAAAHRLRPDSPAIHLALADALLASGDAAAGAAEFRSIVREHPDWARAHHGLGRALLELKKTPEAVAHLVKACELFPRFGPAHYTLALAYRDAGDAEKSRPHLALYQKNRYSWPPLDNPLMAEIHDLNKSAHEHLRRGVALEEGGRIEEAIAAHERALELDPGIVQAHANLITLFAMKNDAAGVEEHYNGALALNPNLAEIHYNYGSFLTAQGSNAEAVALFERALQADPNHPEAHNNLASILMGEGKLEPAQEHLRAALRSKPDYRVARFNLGRLLVHQGKPQEAIEEFKKILAPEDESTPGYLYALGAAYARAGDTVTALEYLKTAREKALAFGQTNLLGPIERDLRTLGSR